MLLFFVDQNTTRFKYISRLICTGLLGLEIKIVTDKEEYEKSELPKVYYSRNTPSSGLHLHPSHLLFESDISDQQFQKGKYKEDFVFYLTNNRSVLPYDPLAASFFLVSRYEEYMPFIADEHNRFPAKESLAYKNKVLDRPLVNIFANHLAEVLLERYPELSIKKNSYSFINSVDIDNAYAYLGKGIFRTLGGFGNDFFSFKFHEAVNRFKTLIGINKDPFETFDYQLELQEKYGYETIFFALFSKLGKHDRSLTSQSPRLRRFLKSVNDFCQVGIHPSYQSNFNPKLGEEELRSLESILHTNITQSRQHFLILKFPDTYRHLLDIEITHDYSMGYAAEAGFRAGICTPFRFYDLELEVETPLIVHPFPFMDGTFIYYKKQDPVQSWEEIKKYIATYREFGGEFIPIWHNRVFSEKMPEWIGWNRVFEKMVEAAS
jgi:hypothetical protein